MEQQQTPTAAQQELQRLIAENKQTFDRHIKDANKLVKQLAKTLTEMLAEKVIYIKNDTNVLIIKVSGLHIPNYNKHHICISGDVVDIDENGYLTQFIDDARYFDMRDLQDICIVDDSEIDDIVKRHDEMLQEGKELYKKYRSK